MSNPNASSDRTHNVEKMRRRWAVMNGWLDVSVEDGAPLVGRHPDHPMMEPARLPEPLEMGTEGFIEALAQLTGLRVAMIRGDFSRNCAWRVEIGEGEGMVWCEAPWGRAALCNATVAYFDRVWSVENPPDAR